MHLQTWQRDQLHYMFLLQFLQMQVRKQPRCAWERESHRRNIAQDIENRLVIELLWPSVESATFDGSLYDSMITVARTRTQKTTPPWSSQKCQAQILSSQYLKIPQHDNCRLTVLWVKWFHSYHCFISSDYQMLIHNLSKVLVVNCQM